MNYSTSRIIPGTNKTTLMVEAMNNGEIMITRRGGEHDGQVVTVTVSEWRALVAAGERVLKTAAEVSLWRRG